MQQTSIIKNIILDRKVYVYLFIMLCTGILLMLIKKPASIKQSTDAVPANSPNISYEENINHDSNEYKLINILKKVEGVGNVDIIINYVSTPEKVPLVETSSQNHEKIVSKTEGSKTEPYIVTELNPEIEGVVVVAEGGNNINVSNILKTTVSAYLGVPMHKVNVLKMK